MFALHIQIFFCQQTRCPPSLWVQEWVTSKPASKSNIYIYIYIGIYIYASIYIYIYSYLFSYVYIYNMGPPWADDREFWNLYIYRFLGKRLGDSSSSSSTSSSSSSSRAFILTLQPLLHFILLPRDPTHATPSPPPPLPRSPSHSHLWGPKAPR